MKPNKIVWVILFIGVTLLPSSCEWELFNPEKKDYRYPYTGTFQITSNWTAKELCYTSDSYGWCTTDYETDQLITEISMYDSFQLKIKFCDDPIDVSRPDTVFQTVYPTIDSIGNLHWNIDGGSFQGAFIGTDSLYGTLGFHLGMGYQAWCVITGARKE